MIRQIASAATTPASSNPITRSFERDGALGACVWSARFKDAKLLKLWLSESADGEVMEVIVSTLRRRSKELMHA